MPILDNPFGVFFYLMLRNDRSWALLSSQERELILRVNRSFNAEREDYANPELYGTGRVEGGENWDSPTSRLSTQRGRNLVACLGETHPKNVLEIGPGPGFFSRTVCELPSVTKYTAIDVGAGFLNYLRPRLESLEKQKPEFKFRLLQGQLADQEASSFDFILLLSCVHHIPNRTEFFAELSKRLKPGGFIFCYDPSHYLSRWARLLRAMWSYGYLSSEYYRNRDNLSTHHFCTIGEYRKIVKRLPELSIAREFYVPAKRVARYPWLARWFPRLVSVEMGILLRKGGHGE